MGTTRAGVTGVTVMPEFFQVEGIEAVLDNLQRRARVTAIATSPYVMAPMPDGQGGREPPIDAGAGSVRLLDRPLWGRRELFVRTAPSFAPTPRSIAACAISRPPRTISPTRMVTWWRTPSAPRRRAG
jgi:hypothetical protein